MCSSASRVILNSRRGLHIKPSGESGKGKSDAIECFLELLPEGSYITGSMSAKALFYDPNLKAGTLIYSDDASFADDVISTIKQSTSKFQKPTFHRTVVNGEAQTYPIPERTTYWFSAVEGMDDDQLANRFLHADVDSSSEQDKRVHQRQKDSEEEYEAEEIDPDVLLCRCIFSIVFSQTFRVKIPFVKCIQWNNTENRRNFEKFTDVIRAVTVFNYRKREVFEGFLMATVEDYERALKIYKGTSVNNATNLTNTELEYLKYIVDKTDRTVTQKELVKHFNVTETAVRRMLNGRHGDGGLLAKIKQLVTEEREKTKEKFYRYSGELTSLDMYAAVSILNTSEVEGVTNEFKARLIENKSRVTRGNQGVTKPEVTPENNYSRDNNIINNIGVTIDREYESDNNLCVSSPVVENNTHTKSQVTPVSAKCRLPLQENDTGKREDGVTPPKLPQVRVGYPSPQNDIGGIENDGCPSNDNENENKGLASLLRMALVKLAKSNEYHGIVEDVHGFVKVFNEKTPEYKDKLGNHAVLSNAEKLQERGWK